MEIGGDYNDHKHQDPRQYTIVNFSTLKTGFQDIATVTIDINVKL